jgi:hypothetical protein
MRLALAAVMVLLVAAAALVLVGPRASSLRARYRADVAAGLARTNADWAGRSPPVVTDDDLAPLPAPVATYLRRAGIVGKPRVVDLHAIFHARFRTARDAPWMDAKVDQWELFGPSPSRLFLMEASRAGVPFLALHRYVGDAATMQVRLLGLFPLVDARGPEMTRSETVTLFNDMCLLAPATLLDAKVAWRARGAREVEATFANAGHVVSAVLSFDAAGDLVGFVSADRAQSDGKATRRLPWSTPVLRTGDFGGVRLAAEAEARWREPSGEEWTYGAFTLERVEYNSGLDR